MKYSCSMDAKSLCMEFRSTSPLRNAISSMRLTCLLLPLLEVIRDIFVFHCYIGCRVGDLYRLTRENIKDGFVEYMPQRTKEMRGKDSKSTLA